MILQWHLTFNWGKEKYTVFYAEDKGNMFSQNASKFLIIFLHAHPILCSRHEFIETPVSDTERSLWTLWIISTNFHTCTLFQYQTFIVHCLLTMVLFNMRQYCTTAMANVSSELHHKTVLVTLSFQLTIISTLITKLNEWTYGASPSWKTDTPQLV
jgi:hypothetical protein